ncbi:Uncharacterized protein HZ326_31505, partial [Fusarium oxysporum f. sp. albedinis]
MLSQKILTDCQIAPERSSLSYVLLIEPDLPAVPIRSNRLYPDPSIPGKFKIEAKYKFKEYINRFYHHIQIIIKAIIKEIKKRDRRDSKEERKKKKKKKKKEKEKKKKKKKRKKKGKGERER